MLASLPAIGSWIMASTPLGFSQIPFLSDCLEWSPTLSTCWVDVNRGLGMLFSVVVGALAMALGGMAGFAARTVVLLIGRTMVEATKLVTGALRTLTVVVFAANARARRRN